MRITIKVKAGAKVEKIEKLSRASYVITTRSPAIDGKANESAREILADFFSIPKSRVVIIRGHTSKNKIIDII